MSRNDTQLTEGERGVSSPFVSVGVTEHNGPTVESSVVSPFAPMPPAGWAESSASENKYDRGDDEVYEGEEEGNSADGEARDDVDGPIERRTELDQVAEADLPGAELRWDEGLADETEADEWGSAWEDEGTPDWEGEDESDAAAESLTARSSPAMADEAPYEVVDGEAPIVSGLRDRIVQVARQEWEKWGRGTKREKDPSVTGYLQDYYAVGVKAKVSPEQLQDARWQANHPWSAVFISYVMRKAGAEDAFKYSPAHTAYVCAAQQARAKTDRTKFWAYAIREVRPEVGDLICKDRKVCVKKVGGRCTRQCAGTRYENVCRGGNSHCDIVVEVDRANNRIKAIGGNVDHSVGARTFALDSNGFLLERAGDGCRWIAVVKPPAQGRVGPSAPGGANVWASLPRALADAVRQGVITLQAGLAIASGQRDINTLTDMVFYSRHPKLPLGYKIRPHDQALRTDWVRIRDQVIQPLLRILSPAARTTTAPAGHPPIPNARASAPRAAGNVEKWAPLSDPIAKARGVDPNFVLGIIAAESRGDEKKVAKSGYLGLMQAKNKKHDPNLRQLDPRVSVTTGVDKLVDFRTVLEEILRKHDLSRASMPRLDWYKMLALCYNAGHVTVAKALDYAAASGDLSAWLADEHYQRALLFSGAFSTAQAADSCLRNQDAAVRADAVRIAERDRDHWWFGTRCERWRECSDPPPWSEVSPQLSAFTRCAIGFKHRNTPRYWNTIRTYMEHFEKRRPALELLDSFETAKGGHQPVAARDEREDGEAELGVEESSDGEDLRLGLEAEGSPSEHEDRDFERNEYEAMDSASNEYESAIDFSGNAFESNVDPSATQFDSPLAARRGDPNRDLLYDGSHPAPGTVETRRSYPTNPPIKGDPSNRNGMLYDNIVNQFAVGVNPRYKQTFRAGVMTSTYCNIFCWDVTRAMGAEIPHWVNARGEPVERGSGKEMNANATHDWLIKYGSRYSWRRVADPEVAQAHANAGHPAIASFKNRERRRDGKGFRPGHLAVIRPGELTGKGPSIAQAGKNNFNKGRLGRRLSAFTFWVHGSSSAANL